jgi:hypothetical protein
VRQPEGFLLSQRCSSVLRSSGAWSGVTSKRFPTFRGTVWFRNIENFITQDTSILKDETISLSRNVEHQLPCVATSCARRSPLRDRVSTVI